MRTFTKQLSIAALLAVLLAFRVPTLSAQTAIPSTTLTAALTANVQNSTVCLASVSSILQGAGNFGGLYVDLEYMQVTGTNATNSALAPLCVTVIRGQQGTTVQRHANAQTVWIDQYLATGIDSGFRYGNTQPQYGPCTSTATFPLTRPVIYVGNPDPFAIEVCEAAGSEFANGVWTPLVYEQTAMIGPGNCAWGTTGTYDAQVAVATGGPNLQGLLDLGASFVPANQIKTTAAGASVNTLSCWFHPGIFGGGLLGKGITVTSVDVLYGVATTTLTSISGGAFATVTFPAPGATQTASTVTPVAVGGAVTQSSSTGNMAATTAGAFKLSRLTPATPINLVTDRVALIISLNFNQSAAAAQVVNTPGMLVHYTYNER